MLNCVNIGLKNLTSETKSSSLSVKSITDSRSSSDSVGFVLLKSQLKVT